MDQPMRELPRYQCHKKVWALKIAKIDTDQATLRTVITPEEDGYAPFEVSVGYMQKHVPQVGGYYVQYEDGYLSYSPAKAFEDGYTKIS